MHYVYVLQDRGANFYIGYTADLKRRALEHAKNGYSLKYYEAFQTPKAARARERLLKHYGSAWRALRKRIAT